MIVFHRDTQGGLHETPHRECPGLPRCRPMVMVDPMDQDDAGRLAAAFQRNRPANSNAASDRAALSAALEDLTYDGKPPEPPYLGAVVEDSQGRMWSRWSTSHRHPWTLDGVTDGRPENRAYDGIDAVAVHAPGTPPRSEPKKRPEAIQPLKPGEVREKPE